LFFGNGVLLVNHMLRYQLSLSVLKSLVVVLLGGISPSKDESIVLKLSLGLSDAGVVSISVDASCNFKALRKVCAMIEALIE
jgi:hydroxymethylglutaryl-CoA reductase